MVELPVPIESSGSASTAESATVLALSPTTLVASDGHGRLYSITISTSPASITSSFTLSYSPDAELSPFRLHSVDLTTDGDAVALLSTVVKVAPAALGGLPQRTGPAGMSTAPRAKVGSTTAFDYVAVNLGQANAAGAEVAAEKELEVRWRLRAADLPTFVAFVKETGSYAIGAASPLADPNEAEEALTMPTRSSNNPTNPAPAVAGSAVPSAPAFVPSAPRPPPYSWTQDSDSLTLIFTLPSSTPTSAIRATFSRQFLSLIVGTARAALANPSSASGLAAQTVVSHKRFWGEVDPHSSIWTFDREAEGRDSDWGLLSLHLEKAHAGTKWPDVFAARAEGEPAAEGEEALENVAETVDPSELLGIVERMEQWHRESGLSGLAGAGLEGDEVGGEMPTSLQGEEMDVEVDGDSGTPIVLSWVTDALAKHPRVVRPPAGMSFSLLSTALPLANPVRNDSVVVKHDVDGCVFCPAHSAGRDLFAHTATFPALAFVLASKRDLHFACHVGDRVALAFDSPSQLALATAGRAGGADAGTGSLFVYWNTEVGTSGKRETCARQAVVKVGSGGEGALLGVAGVVRGEGSEGKVVVVALCERGVVVFRPM